MTDSITSLDDLESYYWHQYEIASLPISKRPVNTDLLTRSEREILNCTTKIDKALGIPLFINKNQKVQKDKAKRKLPFPKLKRVLSTCLSYILQAYSNFLKFLNLCLILIWDIATMLYGRAICGIFEILVGESSLKHLLLLCVVIITCSSMQKSFKWPRICIVLYLFPLLWQSSLTFLSAPNYRVIPSFMDTLKSYAPKKKGLDLFKSRSKKESGTTLKSKSDDKYKPTPEERVIALLKKMESEGLGPTILAK